MTADGGILESNEQECGIKRRMLKNSKTKYYLGDKSTAGSIGFVKLADFDEIDFFITDAEPCAALAAQLDDGGASVIVV